MDAPLFNPRWEALEMKQPARTRFAIVSVACGAVLLGVAFLVLHLISPFDGARLDPGQSVWSSEGVVVTPLENVPGGLRPGDVVVAVDGKSLESWAQVLFNPGSVRSQWHAGQT